MKVWRYDLIPDGGWEAHGHAPGEAGTGYEAVARNNETGDLLPRDAEILSYNITTKGVSLYALVEGLQGQEGAERTFYVCGNDVELPDGVTALHYRSTAKITGGVTAHVFELTHLLAAGEAPKEKKEKKPDGSA